MTVFLILSIALFAGATSETSAPTQTGPVVLRFYYPVGVAGPLANSMNELCMDFTKANPNIIVEPIYSGGYVETMQRSLTASKAGNPPDIALLTSADVWTAVDEGIITPLKPFIDAEGGEAFLANYFKGFLEDCSVSGEYYAIPFQKSTPIFYYNKDMFREAGLDPNHAPSTWQELRDIAAKLVKKTNNETTRWGVQIPIDQWIFSIMIMQNGGTINNLAGTETYFNTPEAIGAAEFLQSLVKEGLMPAKRLFGDSSADFVAGKTAMMYNSTGSLTFVRNSATFDWGVAYLPAQAKQLVATGGGQLVIMKGVPENRQKAAWEFVKWMTKPEQAARWSRITGYVAVNVKSFDVPEMAAYVADFPFAVVAREQLQYAVGEPPKTHSARQIAKLMSDTIEGVLAGKITPKDGMATLQTDSEKVLAAYK